MSSRKDLAIKYECKGCVCLKCTMKGDCHCPLKRGGIVPAICDNFLTDDERKGIMK